MNTSGDSSRSYDRWLVLFTLRRARKCVVVMRRTWLVAFATPTVFGARGLFRCTPEYVTLLLVHRDT